MSDHILNSSSHNFTKQSPFLNGNSPIQLHFGKHNWSSTTLGPIELWKPNLLVTLGMILQSKHPALLLWGPECICLFNDAFKLQALPGNSNSPLGKPASEIWPQHWKNIQPIILNALQNHENIDANDLLPLLSTDPVDKVIWTSSYNPVMDEMGNNEGLFITFIETTSYINSIKLMEENEHRYRTLIDEATVATALYEGPELIITHANSLMLGYWGKSQAVIGKPLREALPELENQLFFPILERIYKTGEPYVGVEDKAQLLVNDKLKTYYFNFTYKPLRNKQGDIYAIHNMAIDVTEQVISRQEIIDAEQKKLLAIQSADLGVYELNFMTDEMFTDERFNNIWGFKEQAARRVYADAIHPADRLIRTEAHNQALVTGQLTYQARVIWADLSEHWVRIRGKVIYTQDGKPEKLLGVVQDITEHLSAQKKVEESERNIRNMIVHAPIAMCIFKGPDYVVETANNKMYELWGKEMHEVLGKPIFEGLPEARDQGLEVILEKVYTNSEMFIANERNVQLPRNGVIQNLFINFAYQPLIDSTENTTGILAVAVDVTQLVMARQKVEEAEARARLAIETTGLGIVEANFETGELTPNQRFYEIFELSGKLSVDVLTTSVYKDDRPIIKQALEQAKQTGFVDYEARLLMPNGGKKWIRTRGNIVFDDQLNPLRIFSVIQDISEQKLFAQVLKNTVKERTKELAEANLQLQQSNIELNQFAYIASHDLQEPLRKVRTFTNMISTTLQDIPTQTSTYLQKIQDFTERMQTLINDVLRFSLLSKGKEKFTMVDLNEVLHYVLNDYELLIEQKRATITTNKLPTIEAIPIQMTQLFTNLISNALKFNSPERDLEIMVNATIAAKEEVSRFKELNEDKVHFKIEVTDNGIGFNQDYAQQIFTIFQRLHGRKEYSGTGIGLAMCKKIVTNHYGVINATGHPGQKSTFTIFLPDVQDENNIELLD